MLKILKTNDCPCEEYRVAKETGAGILLPFIILFFKETTIEGSLSPVIEHICIRVRTIQGTMRHTEENIKRERKYQHTESPRVKYIRI